MLNYDIDSEEEWGEFDGEDLGNEDVSDDGSDDSECINEGWIVDDDAILSESDNFDDGEGGSILKNDNQRKSEMMMKIENRKRLEHRRNEMLSAQN